MQRLWVLLRCANSIPILDLANLNKSIFLLLFFHKWLSLHYLVGSNFCKIENFTLFPIVLRQYSANNTIPKWYITLQYGILENTWDLFVNLPLLFPEVLSLADIFFKNTQKGDQHFRRGEKLDERNFFVISSLWFAFV